MALSGLVCLACTACGAGFNAASLDMTPRSGAARIGDLRINNVWVVMDPATRNAEIIGAVANSGRRSQSDQLLSVTADGMPATIRPATPAAVAAALPNDGVSVTGNTVTIAGGSTVAFGRPGRPDLEISDAPFTLGHLTRVELDFAKAGRTTVTALTMPPTGLFAAYNPNENDENSTVGPKPSPTTKPIASTTPSPTATPTATASGYALNKASNSLSTDRTSASTPTAASPFAASHPAHIHGHV